MLSLVGMAAVALYVYVAVAAGRMEHKAGSMLTVVIIKAATWPATIWHSIDKLYLTKS